MNRPRIFHRSNTGHYRSRVFVAGVAAGALLCSSFAVGVGATVKPKDVPSVTIGYSSSSINVLPFWVGQSEGIFAAHGVNIKAVLLTAATLNTALVGGSVSYVTQNSTGFLQARAAGLPVEAIEDFVNGVSVALCISNQFASAHGITTKTPVKTIITDLIGSTGGSSSTATTGQAYVLLKSYGVQPSQVTEASFANLSAVIAAFDKNQINWFVASEPNPLEVQGLGYGIVVADRYNAPAWQQKQINQILQVDTNFANADPGISREVVGALAAADKYIAQHEQKVITIAEQNLPGVSRVDLFKSIQIGIWPTSAKMNENLWRSTVNFDVRAGQVVHGTQVKEGVDWTNAYAGK